MLGIERAKQLTQQALGISKADQTEIILVANESALTRFANNYIHQNVAESNIEARVRVVTGKKTGVASTNDVTPEGLSRMIQTAQAISLLQPENPDFRGLPSSPPAQNAETFVERTATCTPETRARAVQTITKKAKAANLVAAGAFATSSREVIVANSLGTFQYHPGTVADLHTVAMGDNGSAYAAFASADLSDINAERIADEAISKALRAQNPQPIEPGEYTVLLEEYAVDDLIDFLSFLGLNALAVQEQRSFMKDKIGEKVMHESVTIWDDGTATDTFAMPFDYEGVPKQKLMLIENGIARGVAYDSYTAGRDGTRSTGHALPSPNTYGPLPMHTFMAAGDKSKEELIKSIDRGILVTRFWYTRVVHPMKVMITGMTRDGVFLVENGQVTRPVRNMRFTTSYLDALNHVRAIGQGTRLFHEQWSGRANRVPALVVDGFNFTGVTQF